jgi:ribose transport system permease protein
MNSTESIESTAQSHRIDAARIGALARDFGPLIALILLAILGWILNPSFGSWTNITNVLTRSAITGIISVGATFVIVSGEIDLSVGAMVALIASLMIIIVNQVAESTGNLMLAVAAGLAAGLIIGIFTGLINGILVTKGKIDSFIVTLGTMGIFRSLVIFVANGGTLTLNSDVREAFRPIYYDAWLSVPIPVWVLALVAVSGAIVLAKTRFGRYCRAVGSNADVAFYSAIRVDRIRLVAFVVQGFCVALATILYVPRLGSASSGTAVGGELEAITAVVVGGTALRGGYGRVWGSIAGALILTLIGNILDLTSIISVYLNGAVQGLIILGAALLQRGSRKR